MRDEHYWMASNNTSLQIMMNKEEDECVQIAYQRNGLLSNRYFLFVFFALLYVKLNLQFCATDTFA